MARVSSPENKRNLITKYNPENKERGLFASYINTFLKYKEEASGPPEWINTPNDAKRYIDLY